MVNYFLPDTNILVYAFKGIEPYASVISNIIRKNKLLISSVVAAEFLAGASKKEKLSIEILINKFNVLPVDLKVAKIAGEYKKKYSQKTKKIWLIDCLIAATCKVYDATLITSNKRDYPMTILKL